MQEAGWWKTWQDVRQLADGKRLVFYGRSEDWIPKSLKKVSQVPDYIVDMNEGYHGTSYQEIEVHPPEKLFSDDKESVYVVITSGVYEGIVENLLREGFEPGRQFCCCPEYRDFLVLDSIRNYTQDVYITCCDYNDSARTRGSRGGGGIFRYSLPEARMERLAQGQYRQVVTVEDRIYAVAYVERKIHVFDRSFELIGEHPLDHPNYCGLAHDAGNDTLAIVNAATDEILIHDRTSFELIDRVTFSRKSAQGQNSAHHLNDVCIDGESLYVSYFSRSGNWKIGQYDGGISEFQIQKGGSLNPDHQPVVSGLWSPHSPTMADGNLCYLDSMRGRLHVNNQTIAGEFTGFTRGLAHDGTYFFIGMSEDMYMSRVFSVRPSIMLNAGFFLFEPNTKACRFYPMLDHMNLHDIFLL